MRFGAEFARQSKPRPKWPGFLSLQHGRDIGKRIISVGRQGDAISECRDSLEVATNVDQLTINCEWVIRRSMMCSLTLEYLAEQQRRMLADQRTMHDEMLVQGAMLRRLDNTQGALLDELRTIHALLARIVDRVRALED